MGVVNSTDVKFSELYNYGFNFTTIYNGVSNLASHVGDIRPDKQLSGVSILRNATMRESGDTSVNSTTTGAEWKASNTINTKLPDGVVTQGVWGAGNNNYGYDLATSSGTIAYGNKWNPHGIANGQLSENTVAITHQGSSIDIYRIAMRADTANRFEIWFRSSSNFAAHSNLIDSFSLTTSEIGTPATAPNNVLAYFHRCVTFTRAEGGVSWTGLNPAYLFYFWTESDVGSSRWNEMTSIWDGNGTNCLISFNGCVST